MMESTLQFVDALPHDHRLLSETANTSKRFGGYPDAWIQVWQADLEVSADYIQQHKVVKVFHGDLFIGFFALKSSDANETEIDHLWLLPAHIKKGYGRFIFQYIIDYLIAAGIHKASLIAEPHAKGFYDKMGGEVCGNIKAVSVAVCWIFMNSGSECFQMRKPLF